MPALAATAFTGRIHWLGRVSDRGKTLASAACSSLALTLEGAEGEVHGGLTRRSCARVTALHPRGTTIRNSRQLALIGADELRAIAADLGLAELDPGLLGTTIVVAGLPDVSHLPPSARLQGPDGATLVVDMENRPCSLPARLIEAAHPGKGARFKGAARGRRGVVAWVERAGTLRLGDSLRLFVPDQPAWRADLR